MSQLIPELITVSAKRDAQAPALSFRNETLSYGKLDHLVTETARGLVETGLGARDRVAVYLPKQIETIAAIFGASRAGGVYVPVNPALKERHVGYILQNCNVRILVTSPDRLSVLKAVMADCKDLQTVILVGDRETEVDIPQAILRWHDLIAQGETSGKSFHRTIDDDMAAILYTSGSTGMPKGVVLSHRNMMAGAKSVAGYLNNTPDDRLLAVLPLSFDYGFSQLTTAFHSGASVRLMNYLLPRDILREVVKHDITGLACVPPLWIQLAELDWPKEAAETIRYITSTGGRMPHPLVMRLREVLPKSEIFLMYGLTEAFRSTYLPPDEIDSRPNSIGKAIPNAEILVVRPDGTLCDPDEPGELVHRGALVGMGYWNDPERTAERYKPAPGRDPSLPIPEMAVWSGDTVKKDKDGYIYFVGRRDEMIKTSGFRVSPTEVEESVYASGLVGEAAAIGVEHSALGQAIVIVATGKDGKLLDAEAVIAHCRRDLPSYMVPKQIIVWDSLPRNPNGKIDRKAIAAEIGDPYGEEQGR